MLIQTKRAIDVLLKAGLKRSEFSVQCKRIMQGRTFVGYGDLHIYLRAPIEKCVSVAPKLAESFKVTHYRIDGVVRHVAVDEANGKPGMYYRDLPR